MLENYKALGVVTGICPVSLEKQFVNSYKIHGISTPLDVAIPFLGMCPESLIERTTRLTYEKMFTVAVAIVVKSWKPLKGPQRSDSKTAGLYAWGFCTET